MKKQKILITGTNAYHCNFQHRLRKCCSFGLWTMIESLNYALTDMGYDVTQKMVIPGEDLSEYDKVFVAYYDHTRGGQSCAYGALWAMHARKDAIIIMDDANALKWHASEVKKTLSLEQLNKLIFKDYLMETQAVSVRKAVEDEEIRELMRQAYLENLFENRMFLYNAFSQFNVKKIIDVEHSYAWINPEPYFDDVKTRIEKAGLVSPLSIMMGEDPFEKKDQWLISGFNRPKLLRLTKNKTTPFEEKFSWPMEIFARPTVHPTAKVAPEAEVFLAFARSRLAYYNDTGVIGANWWRTRMRAAADMGCVQVIEFQDEAEMFGPAYMNLSVDKVESMTTSQLEDLAARQKEDFYKSNPLCKDTVKSQLNKVLGVK